MTNSRAYIRLIAVVFCLIIAFPLSSQINLFEKDSVNADSTPFSTENIGSQTEKTQALIRRFWSELNSYSQKDKIDSLTRKRIVRVKDYQKNLSSEKIEQLDFREVDALQKAMVDVRSQLEATRNQLGIVFSGLSDNRAQVSGLKERWEKTLNEQKTKNRPQQVLERIETNITDLNELLKELSRQNNLYLTRQDEITGAIIFLDDMLTTIEKVLENYRTQIFSTDSPPLWHIFSSEKDTVSYKTKMINTFQARKQSIINRQVINTQVLMVYILLIVIFLLGVLYVKRRLENEEELKKSPSITLPLVFISRPFSTSLLLAILLLSVFFPNATSEIKNLVRLTLIIPIVHILPNLWSQIPRRYFNWAGIVYLIVILIDLFTGFIILNRILVLVNGLIMAGILFFLLIWLRKKKKELGEGVLPINEKVLFIGLISVSASVLINIIGNSYLSSILFYGVLTLVFGGLIVFSAVEIMKSFFELIVRHRLIVDLNIFRNYPDQILLWITKLISYSAIVFWLAMSAKSYLIYEPIYNWLESILTASLELGSVNISLGNILAFLITLALTVYISKFIRFILEDEVFTHIEMPRGVPGAITMLVRLTLLGFGFMLAFGAAEIDISNITIIFGALGVGIGFGLQNIFNNLVSGLILAFERPIQVGDVLQISNLNLMGEVKEIGIRASTIRTFDGAEVIVPNGNLISNEMVNWTLSDRRRRQEIAVGVSYGTELTTVLEILEKVVSEQDNVMKKPAPVILFRGFGDSSLDFRVMFWTHFDEGLTTKSKVGIAIDDAFKKAGITIPFPQRDLHIYQTKADGQATELPIDMSQENESDELKN